MLLGKRPELHPYPVGRIGKDADRTVEHRPVSLPLRGGLGQVAELRGDLRHLLRRVPVGVLCRSRDLAGPHALLGTDIGPIEVERNRRPWPEWKGDLGPLAARPHQEKDGSRAGELPRHEEHRLNIAPPPFAREPRSLPVSASIETGASSGSPAASTTPIFTTTGSPATAGDGSNETVRRTEAASSPKTEEPTSSPAVAAAASRMVRMSAPRRSRIAQANRSGRTT